TASWEQDMAGEWFPVLANRPSVLTPQGSEWLGARLYARKICLFQNIRDVAGWQNGIADLEAWASERGVTYTDLYVSRAARGPVNWSAMLSSAERSGNYSVLVDNSDVAVLHRTSALAARWPESGEFVVADDCRSLADEGPQAMTAFEGSFGGQAAAAWVGEHNAALPTRPSVTSLLGRVVAPVLHG
ncbi:MAG: hypothetical protein JOY61_06670, partial [Chloroflexi bacterium]|nr:hypothetical protein [Chloroflexota bacterium]